MQTKELLLSTSKPLVVEVYDKNNNLLAKIPTAPNQPLYFTHNGMTRISYTTWASQEVTEVIEQIKLENGETFPESRQSIAPSITTTITLPLSDRSILSKAWDYVRHNWRQDVPVILDAMKAILEMIGNMQLRFFFLRKILK